MMNFHLLILKRKAFFATLSAENLRISDPITPLFPVLV